MAKKKDLTIKDVQKEAGPLGLQDPKLQRGVGGINYSLLKGKKKKTTRRRKRK